MFELEGGQGGLHNKVDHGGDLLFYYAILAGAVVCALAILQWVAKWSPRLSAWLPEFPRVLEWLLEVVQQLIIFLGIYMYLLHRGGGKNVATQPG